MPLLPPYCKDTREPHTDRSFCNFCGPASDSQPTASLAVPPASQQPVSQDVRISSIPTPSVIDLSESPMAIRTNPHFSGGRVAQTAKDLTGYKRSSRESMKAGYHAGAPPISNRFQQKPKAQDHRCRFAVRLISQALIEGEDDDIICGSRTIFSK
jgi:hypothetical protein